MYIQRKTPPSNATWCAHTDAIKDPADKFEGSYGKKKKKNEASIFARANRFTVTYTYLIF